MWFNHHEKIHFIFRDRLQVGNGEGLGERGASSQSLRHLDRGGEAV